MLYGYIVYIKTDDIYKSIAEDVGTRFDTSNYKLERPLPKGKIKKVIALNKDGLSRKILTKLGRLRPKTYNYLIDDGSEDKKTKDTKKCATKRNFKFENYKNCLEVTQLENKKNNLKKYKTGTYSLKEFIKINKSILKKQQRFKSERHNVFTEKINKIAVNSNDDKKMQSIDLEHRNKQIGSKYGTSKDLVSDKEEIKCNNIIKGYKS